VEGKYAGQIDFTFPKKEGLRAGFHTFSAVADDLFFLEFSSHVTAWCLKALLVLKKMKLFHLIFLYKKQGFLLILFC
jgi:hypothetical protein